MLKFVEENLAEIPGTLIQGGVRPSLKPTLMRLVKNNFKNSISANDENKTLTKRCNVCYKKIFGQRPTGLLPVGYSSICLSYHTKNNP